MRAAIAIAGLLLSPATGWAQAAPVRPDLPALIECRQRIGDFNALAPVLADPLKAVALGWTPLDQSNLFMTEYTLNTPIRVFGHSTNHIAFSGASIVAILDLPDPRPLARQLQLELGVDNAEKVMYGRELVSEDTTNPKTGEAMIESVVLSVTNVKSHPGKTVVGCGYSLDLP
ncbi:hypothetical protein RZV17_11895 [Xanthomonas cannabis]|uniref:hypothetical protein n=1 Tax=Xanthomonas TaxID=338 RepID=UPI000ED334A4|nr:MULTISPECIES: hypothetical protein [Xanthomonas]NIK01056.1 hypothetical protein [Xanthomonas cannabis]NIK64953.1 hypothetical protein [Xanthomonas cannabis]RJS05110.1 hypothetical protein XnspCFBP7698_02405 [Xanthomonas sp. CFBP 7698]